MASSIPSVNRPVTGWVRYSGDRDWQEARFATATPVTAARFYVQNLTSGKASSIDLHRVTKMDELEWGKEGVDDLETVEVHIAGRASFEAMWPSEFTGQILDCLWATVDEEANAQAPDIVDLRGDVNEPGAAGAAPAAAWTPAAPTAEGQAPWAAGAPAGGPLVAPDAGAPGQAPPPPSGAPISSIPPPGMAPAVSQPDAPAPLPPPPGANGGPVESSPPVPGEPQPASTGKRRGWRGRRENKMSPIVGVLAVAGCALLAVGGFIMFRGEEPAFLTPEVLSETTINQSTTVAPATTLAPGATTTTTTVVGG